MMMNMKMFGSNRLICARGMQSMPHLTLCATPFKLHRHCHSSLPIVQTIRSNTSLSIIRSASYISNHRKLVQRKNTGVRPFVTASRIVDAAPSSWQPYLRLARLDKPIGTWLLYWPGAWSIAMAANPGALPDLKYLATFAIGAVVMRGAGCTINDMWDVRYDRQVERTRDRPLASGQLSMREAWGFLAAQLSTGLAILCTMNPYTIALGASSMGLVCTYPLFKRITWWPQLVLGLTFNWGALLGWAAVTGSQAWSTTLPLYAAGVSWTLVYDTIYAHQDKRDDERVGVKSTARRFGDRTREWLSGFSVCTVAGLILSGMNAGLDPLLYGAGVGFTAAHLLWQVSTVDIDSPSDCHKKFVANKWIGATLFASIAAARLFGAVPL